MRATPLGSQQNIHQGTPYGNIPEESPINHHIQTPVFPQCTMAFNTQLPFLASINILDLMKLTNDLISHGLNWPPMPMKLPLDIPNFEGKQVEDPGNHVMTFHMWCSLNNIIYDTIRLILFQHTLTGVAAKWYMEQPPASHGTFCALATTFLTYFQLPIHLSLIHI